MLDQFVCLRMVQMRGVDLSLFAFDFDLTMSILFMEPDGTVLGRYIVGAADPSTVNSIAGLKSAAEAALRLHADLPRVRSSLAAKSPPPSSYRRPEEIPYPPLSTPVDEVTDANCIHCHQVNEGMVHVDQQGESFDVASYFRRFPPAENLGFRLDRDDGLLVREVSADAAAARGGMRAGDRLATIAGVPMVSAADVSWALDHLPAESPSVAIGVSRADETVSLTIPLEGDWRHSDPYWRGIIWALPPKISVWFKDDAEDRRAKGIPDDKLGLSVLGVYDENAKRAGLRNGDLVVKVAGHDERMDAQRFRIFCIEEGAKKAHGAIEMQILRNGKRVLIELKY